MAAFISMLFIINFSFPSCFLSLMYFVFFLLTFNRLTLLASMIYSPIYFKLTVLVRINTRSSANLSLFKYRPSVLILLFSCCRLLTISLIIALKWFGVSLYYSSWISNLFSNNSYCDLPRQKLFDDL